MGENNMNQNQWQPGGYGPYGSNDQYPGDPYDPNTGRYVGGYGAYAPNPGPGVSPAGPGEKKPVVPWVVAVIGLALAAIMTFLWFRGSQKVDSLTNKNTSLNAQVDSLTRKNETLTEKVSTLESEILELQLGNGGVAGDLQVLSTIYSFLQSDTAGYASDSYYADEKLLVMHPGEEASLNIVADIADVTISVLPTGNAADADWVTDDFETVAELTVTALEVGVTTLEFTNDTDDQEFQVLVVVVE